MKRCDRCDDMDGCKAGICGEDNRFWHDNLDSLRRAEALSAPLPGEIEAELAAIKAEPLTPEQIEAMMRATTAGGKPKPTA